MGWRRMGGHVRVRGDLWAGGSLYVGSTQDSRFEREAANRILTEDALAVGGTADLRGASRIRGALTLNAAAHSLAGTVTASALGLAGTVTAENTLVLDLTNAPTHIVPYGTVAPTLANNGELEVAHVGGAGGTIRLYIRAGGTTSYVNFTN